MSENTRAQIAAALAQSNGSLRLEPTWVARSIIPAGKRLGLSDDAYHVGERGWIGALDIDRSLLNIVRIPCYHCR